MTASVVLTDILKYNVHKSGEECVIIMHERQKSKYKTAG